MPKRFQDKVVIVTGSSSGIGRATAALFAEEGAKVTITGRNGKTLENTRDVLLSVGCKLDDILSIQGDLTNEDIQKQIVEKTIAKFGKLDILVNNAGGTAPDNSKGEGFEQSIECYDYTMNLNTRTILQLTKLALPHLIRTKGEVIMVSSIAGLSIACPTVSYYAMSKAALDQMTRAMAAKYIADGVRVNSVNPGFVRTSIMEKQGVPAQVADSKNVHEHPIFGALLGNSALGVEIFLVLSGLLAARSWLRQADQPFKEYYIHFILKRILGLFPSVAAFIFIAAGPLIKYLLPRYHNTMISACGVSGILSHLTFTGNWQSTPTCMGYLWYLGLDMQFYIMAPFLLHLLYKHPRRATLTFGLIMAVSCYLRAAYCTAYGVCNKSDVDIPFISYPDSDPATLAKIYGGLWEMYARPYTKCGPFLLGRLTGYFSVYYDKITLGSRSSRLLFSTSAVLAVGTIYAILPEYWYPEQGDNTYNMLYTAIFRTVFATATIGMIIATVYTEKSPVISSIWAILGRLTFNAYLLHMPIIYIFNHLSFL